MYVICIYVHIKYVYNIELYMNYLSVLRNNFGNKAVANFQLHIDFWFILLS